MAGELGRGGTGGSRRRTAISMALVAVLALGGCGGDEDPTPATTTPDATAAAAAAAVSGPPSPLAERLLSAEAIRTAQRIAREQDLDWAVIAATGLTETAGRGFPTGPEGEELIGAIGYTLRAAGAPTSYETALQTRGGDGFANRVLALAGRLREADGRAADAEPATLPFSRPVEGEVVAGFARRYGLLHSGIDINAATGEPIRAAGPGLVLSAAFDSAYGNRTCILHRVEDPQGAGSELTTCYGNQSRFEVQPGDVVEEGDLVGLVGCSGPCYSPHLHFQVLDGPAVSSRAIDPAPFVDFEADGSGGRFSLEEGPGASGS